MNKVRDTRPRLRHASLAAASLAMIAVTLGNVAAADEQPYIYAPQPGATVKLYNSPGDKESAMDAPSLPLHATGPSQHQFYPVTVNGRSYWVNGLDVKVVRKAQAQCSQSAGVQSAATLGAATNRCQ
ncbi:hypothetical protein [Paraburkholderia phytofirmans]|uniref:Uncharacterized protein n=1 Tax=Paraburkholderia phytofirmans (strain DSM 17436 / LMG 22146 / PsJN) TaxID=398527 RepID=B2TEM5_PARPJ|nr:hypothetical protein [Paraburkholderia phytofirmans]ACD18546.1 conserved hypothetical protein [Paraburkholderia phytofirmans PsJN]